MSLPDWVLKPCGTLNSEKSEFVSATGWLGLRIRGTGGGLKNLGLRVISGEQQKTAKG